MFRPMAAMAVRMKTSWNGGNCSTPMRMNRNEEPQMRARSPKAHQACLFVMEVSLSVAPSRGASYPFLARQRPYAWLFALE